SILHAMQYRVVFLLARPLVQQRSIPMGKYIGLPAKSTGHAQSSRTDDSMANGSCLSHLSNARLITRMSAPDGDFPSKVDRPYQGAHSESRANAGGGHGSCLDGLA